MKYYYRAQASTPCQKDPHPASGYELRLGSLIGPVQTCIEVAFQCKDKISSFELIKLNIEKKQRSDQSHLTFNLTNKKIVKCYATREAVMKRNCWGCITFLYHDNNLLKSIEEKIYKFEN